MDWRQRAIDLVKEHGNKWQLIAEILTFEFEEEFKPERVRRFMRDTKGNIVFEDKKPIPCEDDVLEYYSALKTLNNAISNLDTKQTKTVVNINDNKPIGIAFWGDWHVGAKGVDYRQLDADRELVTETDGLYFIGTGDYKDNANALIHANSTLESIATPGMQDLLVKQMMSEVSKKAIALVRGCHDTWDHKLGDKDFIQTLCEIADCVNLWHGGGVTVKLGNQEYKIRVRHKYKGESDLNTTNAQRRLLDGFGPADILCIGHKHYPDMHTLDRMEQEVVYFRSGGYKIYDEYGQQLGGYRAKIGVPVAVLFPDTHRVVPFKTLRSGIEHLKAVRGGL